MRAFLVALLVVLPLAGCAQPGAPAEQKVVVRIVDGPEGSFTFVPARVTALPNQVVEWRNEGNGTHSMQPNEFPVSTRAFGPGESAQLKFGEVGAHGVHCTFHPNMTMVVEIVRG